jgi:hypothetical protein
MGVQPKETRPFYKIYSSTLATPCINSDENTYEAVVLAAYGSLLALVASSTDDRDRAAVSANQASDRADVNTDERE